MKIYHAQPLDSVLSEILKENQYEFVPITDCDFILYHELYNNAKEVSKFIRQLSKQYQHAQKKVLIFLMLDDERDYGHYENLIIVRASAKASKIRYNEIVLPYVWENKTNPYPTSAITDLPTVGFCGLLSKHRKKLVRVFKESNQVLSNFLVRDKFWGGQPHAKNLIADFSANIESNQFTLSNRGAGNFSMRFYQVLSAGRIPVLVNTDMVLPFANKIPWRDILVFEKNEKRCLARVLEIHAAKKTQEMQRLICEIYREFLSPAIYFAKLMEEIQEKSLLQFNYNDERKFNLRQKLAYFFD